VTVVSGPTSDTRGVTFGRQAALLLRAGAKISARLLKGPGMGSSRVELFEAIRRDARREDLSVRALAERHGVHRRTVRAALASAVPPPRKQRVPVAPKLDPAKPLIDAMLREDLTAHRKQHHTARRVLARLVDEHGMAELTYSSVRDYVARRRPQITAEAGRSLETAFVLQDHPPGAEAEVDFGDVWVVLLGSPLAASCSRSACRTPARRCTPSTPQGQEAFIEGHQEAFKVLGGVPTDKIRYDNLRSAVSRVLFGRSRTESDRWVQFRSHMGFDAFYCIPGIDGAHEKGGVEGEVGRFRRLEQADAADDARRIDNRVRTVGQDFAAEAPLLRPLPSDAFDDGLWLTPRVDRYSRVTVASATTPSPPSSSAATSASPCARQRS